MSNDMGSGDSKDVLIKNLNRMRDKYQEVQDNTILGNCLMGVIFARNDEIISQELSDRLLLWISKWANETTPIPSDNEYDLILSKKPIDDSHFKYQGITHELSDFNEVVPLEMKETILNMISCGLGQDRHAESLTLVRVKPAPVFTGNIKDVLGIIDISERRKRDKNK